MFASNNTLASRSWLSTPINNQGKFRKNRLTKEDKWPIFDEFIKIEDDPFWSCHWNNAVAGKFPPGFLFNGKELSYTGKTETYQIEIVGKHEDSIRLLKHMFREHGNIQSPHDIEIIHQREELKNLDKKPSWSKMPKTKKASLILDYVNALDTEHHLTKNQRKLLHQTIIIGVNIGSFNDTNICIEDESIKEIKGLEHDPEDMRFFINIETAPYRLKKNDCKSKEISVRDGLYNDWKSIISTGRAARNKVIDIRIDEDTSELQTTCNEDNDTTTSSV